MDPERQPHNPLGQPDGGVYDELGRPLTVPPRDQTATTLRTPKVVTSSQQASPEQQTSLQQPTAQPLQGATPPQVVYMARPLEPIQPHISDEVKQKHDTSVRSYPQLNLSDGEYVISDIHRHPIGLVQIWGVAGLLIALVILAIIGVMSGSIMSEMTAGAATNFSFILLMVCALVFMGGVIATVVYQANRFYLTNESVTQHIQTSLFAKKEQTISLGNIEDASFRKVGILQHLLDYGSLRLSTEGDETTYRFNYVYNPEKQVATLNNAVESFKNGRPIDTDESDEFRPQPRSQSN